MRLVHFLFLFVSLAALTLAWAADIERAVYNKWHQTELERWLEDHSIPYPAAADRRDLQDLVQKHWNDFTSAKVFHERPDHQFAEFLHSKTGHDPKEAFFNNGLVQRLEGLWSEGWNNLPTDKWQDAKGWVFDSWTDSQLRQFLEHYGVVEDLTPETTREKLISAVKDNYDAISKRVGGESSNDDIKSHSFYYPGDWLYASWSDSDLRNWLLERGWIEDEDEDDDTSSVAASRDQLLMYMRSSWLYNRILNDWNTLEDTVSSAASLGPSAARSYKNAAESSAAAVSKSAAKQARILSSKAQRESSSRSSSASKSASKAAAEASRTIASLESQVMDKWSLKQLRKWAEENGLEVPHDINQKELQSMVQKHRDTLSKEAMSAVARATQTMESGYDAATSSVGSGFAGATHAAASYLWGAAGRLKGAFSGTSSPSTSTSTTTSTTESAESARVDL